MNRFKRFIQWNAPPFIFDVIKNGSILVGLLFASALPAIFALLGYYYFGPIAGLITLIFVLGMISTIVENSI